MRLLPALVLAVVLSASQPSHAQLTQIGVGSGGASSLYTGPGDIVAGATAFYSCSRSYNAAFATGSNNACKLRRASDNTTSNFVILSDGNFDATSADAFAGADATCTGTIASTTLTCASASSTPHAGSTLSGSGVSEPTYIVSCGTFVGGAGTCTLNQASTVSVGETVTMQYGLYVAEAYDQTGNSNSLSQGTNSEQPQWLPNCIRSLPCMSFVRANSQDLTATGLTQYAQPFSTSAVGERNGSTTSQMTLFGGSAAFESIMVWKSSANTFTLYSGTLPTGTTANDNTWHNFQGLFNGASSELNVDGTDTSLSIGTQSWYGTYWIGNDSSGADAFQGYMAEAGFWAVTSFTSAQRTNLCHNQYAYYATSTSC